jgi:F-type H+-transporting ATPase subunit epsilon
MFNALILDYNEAVFRGKARSAVLPGENGVFEVMDFHAPIVSLLQEGEIIIDSEIFPIRKGIVNFYKNTLIAIIER